MKNFIYFAVVIVTATLGYLKHNQTKTMNELMLANIEALASTEMQIGCDNHSVVLICKSTCWTCYTTYTAIGGYGYSTGLKGTCRCGRVY